MKVSTEEAKEICEAVIQDAVEDYQAIPNDCGSAQARQDAEQDRQSAIRFFFDDHSNFRSMARGLGIDVETIRAALLERGQPNKPPRDPRGAQSQPGANYGTFVDRAARVLA